MTTGRLKIWNETAEEWEYPPGGEVGGSQPNALINTSAYQTRSAADATTHLPCDGSEQFVAAILAAPPTWMDGAGNIIAAGMYKIGSFAYTSTPATTPGLYVQIGADTGADSQMVAPVDVIANTQVTVFDVVTLLAADLPFAAQVVVQLPMDVTGVIGVRPFAEQLASS